MQTGQSDHLLQKTIGKLVNQTIFYKIGKGEGDS